MLTGCVGQVESARLRGDAGEWEPVPEDDEPLEDASLAPDGAPGPRPRRDGGTRPVAQGADASSPPPDEVDASAPPAPDPRPVDPEPEPEPPAPRISEGLIIPAYLNAEDRAGWDRVRQGAALLRSAAHPRFRDFWVTVNSTQSGPFRNPSDWARAALNWDPVRASGGKIIGYVHTCVEPAGPHYRPLADVQSEIRMWVEGYPRLDGIWLDEFYPRFEIAGPDGVMATYPNGLELAPKDRSFVGPDGRFLDKQVDPTGGYYEQLTRWIRATYPQLRIVGNAGGTFYSNQQLYHRLVDVVCSFEQTYEVASTDNWLRFARQNMTLAYHHLALVHDTRGNYAEPIERALGFGYTHVFTTDRGTLSTLWNGLPSYFEEQVRYLIERR